MEEINYIVKNELSSCLSDFAYGSNRSSQWIFLVGEKGAGKTQLLNWLQEETTKYEALYLGTKPFPGRKAVDYYLMRQIFDSLTSFSFPQKKVCALKTICTNVLRNTMLQLLKEDDFSTEKLSTNVTQDELRKKAKSSGDFAYLLRDLSQDTLIAETVRKSPLTVEELSWFEKFLRVGLSPEIDKNFINEIFNTDNNLVAIKKALLYLISKGDKTICIGLDKFEETFTIFHKIYPTNKIQSLIKELFLDISELIENSNNLVLVFTCRQDHWTGKHGVLNIVPKKIIGKIRHLFTLRKPSFKEVCLLVTNTLNRFWMKHHFTPPRQEELIFPFLEREVHGIWEYSSSIGYIFIYLEQLFAKSKKRACDGETIEELINRAQKGIETSKKQKVKMRETMPIGQQKILRQQNTLRKMSSKLQSLQLEIEKADRPDPVLKTIYARLESTINEFTENAQQWIDDNIEMHAHFHEQNSLLTRREDEINQKEQRIALQNKLLLEREQDF